ncbi:hypothetical protein [Marinobacter sp. SS21]|uniref:hypothetical protein n=1 Tax=Marinobacter sp. SS21 TaxID=2979460 RepID=UPI00232AC095|nr:hypothetical protein [Marinobacter sp. SS21]MDC0664171.1 hypothetical protein [Marinobacter sp. SS21]
MSIRKRFVHLLVGPIVVLIVGLAAGPVISALFTPEVFGQYSVLLAIVGISVVGVTLRFDQLIPSSTDPHSNMWVVLLSSTALSLLIGALVSFFYPAFHALFIAAATAGAALFNGFYYFRVNADQALTASAGRSVQAAGVLGGQASFGYLGVGMPGLLWGELIGRGLAILTIARPFQLRSIEQVGAHFKSQWPQARWLLPSALLGALALQLLPLGMLLSVGASSAGIFMLVYRMVVVPNSLLSKVANDTLLVELGRLRKEGQDCGPLMEQGFGKLVIAATGIYGVLGVHGTWLFPLVLDGAWSQSGELVGWLSVLVAGWAVASPMASVFVALEKSQWSLCLSLLDLLNRMVALAVGFVAQDVVMACISLACGGVVVYGVSAISSLKLAGGNVGRVVSGFGKFLLLLWAILFLSGVLLKSGIFWGALVLGALVTVLALRRVAFG